MEIYKNLKLIKTEYPSLKDKLFAELKYNIFVCKDRLESTKLKYISGRDLTNKQKNKILQSLFEKLLKSYIKLIYLYNEYNIDLLELDTIIFDANKLQYKILDGNLFNI